MTWSVIQNLYDNVDYKINPLHGMNEVGIKLAGQSGEAIGKATGWKWLENHGKSVQDNPAQGVQDAMVVAALYYGGAAAAGYSGGSGGAAAGATEGAGATGAGWVSGESLGEAAGGASASGASAAPAATEWTSGESLPTGEQSASKGFNWKDAAREGMQQQSEPQQIDVNAQRRQELLDRAQSLREQIAELRQQIAREESNANLTRGIE